MSNLASACKSRKSFSSAKTFTPVTRADLDRITSPTKRYQAAKALCRDDAHAPAYDETIAAKERRLLQELYAERFGEGRRVYSFGPRFVLSRCPVFAWIYDRETGELYQVRLRPFIRFRENTSDDEWAACRPSEESVVRWRADQRDLRAIPGFVEATWHTGIWAKITFDKRRKRQGTYGLWLNRLSVAIAGENVFELEVDHLWGDTEADFAWWLQPLTRNDHQAKERMEDYWQVQAHRRLGYIPEDLQTNDTTRAYAENPEWEEMNPTWTTVEELLAIVEDLESRSEQQTRAEAAAISDDGEYPIEPIQELEAGEEGEGTHAETHDADLATYIDPIQPLSAYMPTIPLCVDVLLLHHLLLLPTVTYSSLAGHPDGERVSSVGELLRSHQDSPALSLALGFP